MTYMPAQPASPRGRSGLLADIGRLLHGDNYVKPLAKTIGKSRKQAGRYLADEAPIPEEVWRALDKSLEALSKRTLRQHKLVSLLLPKDVTSRAYWSELQDRIEKETR